MRITRSLTIPALALGLLAAGSAGSALTQGGWTSNPPATEQVAAAAPTEYCEEDQPCWDCESMGNQICGLPDVPANEARRATAWETWDANSGWHVLRVNPDKEVRVDVVGYSPKPSREHTSLHGADGYWYLFEAR